MGIREDIRTRIKESSLTLNEISEVCVLNEERLKKFIDNEGELSIDELECVADNLMYKVGGDGSYVSQGGTRNINIQLVHFGGEGEKLIEVLTEFIVKLKPFAK